MDQEKLLNELPASLRAEVVMHTHGRIIKTIKFFDDKQSDPDFVWAILPQLKPMNVFNKDILYNQGDLPEEVFFILKGRVKLFYDINFGNYPAKHIAFNCYIEGSYFGDSDVIINEEKVGRDSMAEADCECLLLVLTKKNLMELMENFPSVGNEMRKVAKKRKDYHQKQIEELLQKDDIKEMQTRLREMPRRGSAIALINRNATSMHTRRI